MMKIRNAILIAPLLFATMLPLNAQRGRNDRNNRDYSNNGQFYNGVRNGARGGQYNDPRYNNGNYNYNNNYYNDQQQHQGGIGPGKGALIGGGGGAILGALFGGGLKGTLIGGAAGAGIGAIVGKVHQNNQNKQRNNDYYNSRNQRRR
jgi:hypothetical protein